MPEENYGAQNIQVLEGLDAVRKRPGMYIGSTSIRGLHGVGSSVVNALSTKLIAEVVRGGMLYRIEFSRGKTVVPLKKIGKTDRPDGTCITFYPDAEIFKETIKFDYKWVVNLAVAATRYLVVFTA